MSPFAQRLTATASMCLLASCGGGNDEPPAAAAAPAPAAPAPVAVAAVSGTSFKGPTAAATVCMYQIDNAAADKKGAKVVAQTGSLPTLVDGCVRTANDGTYTFVLPTGTTADLLVESTGGTYCSDESVFDGTACASGGTPIALGAGKLKTVVTPPASGAVASAPLTLLTTAAADGTANLNATNFRASYTTFATNFGVADSTPATDPNAGSLKTTLGKLAAFLGGDTKLLDAVLTEVRKGNVTAKDGAITAKPLACTALTEADVGTQAIPLRYLRSGCLPHGTGGSMQVGYEFSSPYLRQALAGEVINGTSWRQTYPAANCTGNRDQITYVEERVTLRITGTASVPPVVSDDVQYSPSGTATKIEITTFPKVVVGVTAEGTTHKHLFCKSRSGNQTTFGYLTAVGSPLSNGSLSRLDTRVELSGTWSD